MSRITEAALARAAPDWPERLRHELADRGMLARFDDGTVLFDPGDRCEAFLIPISGSVRVEHVAPSGRTVVLYRVAPGESCVLTTSCLISGTLYTAHGVAEGPVEAVALNAAAFRRLLDEDPDFREMTLGAFVQRISELVHVIDELLLRRVDLRLAQWLAAQGDRVAATHQSIAFELGTAREVVSRILKEFERRDWIRMSRGIVEVLDREALAHFGREA